MHRQNSAETIFRKEFSPSFDQAHFACSLLQTAAIVRGNPLPCLQPNYILV
jgi:hypothetical protein